MSDEYELVATDGDFIAGRQHMILVDNLIVDLGAVPAATVTNCPLATAVAEDFSMESAAEIVIQNDSIGFRPSQQKLLVWLQFVDPAELSAFSNNEIGSGKRRHVNGILNFIRVCGDTEILLRRGHSCEKS